MPEINRGEFIEKIGLAGVISFFTSCAAQKTREINPEKRDILDIQRVERFDISGRRQNYYRVVYKGDDVRNIQFKVTPDDNDYRRVDLEYRKVYGH
ncbi:MAG: hypothetical protein WC533_00465 [Candidatus Pacearchaeota archaeon]